MFSFLSDPSSFGDRAPEYSEILAVTQWEYGCILPEDRRNYPRFTHIQTDWLSTCSGLAMYSSSTWAFWLGHFDEGINIPASIYAIRKLFDKFFLYGDGGELDRDIRREIARRAWAILAMKYNGHIANLRLDARTGKVAFAPRIDDHPRYQMITHERVFPISFYKYPLWWKPVIIHVDPKTETLHPLINFERNIREVARIESEDPKMREALDEWEILDT